MQRWIVALAFALFSAGALAQSDLFGNARQVELLAPQLVAFAGSPLNFESLVNGLTLGTPVTITSANLQTVSFTPGTTLSPLDAARALESARQALISAGIANPSAEQLAAALVGGSVTTATGASASLPGVLGTSNVAVRVQNQTISLPPGNVVRRHRGGLDLAALQAGLIRGGTISVATRGAGGTPQTTIFTVPGGPMDAVAAEQSIQLASLLLAQQGILNPTPQQFATALVGGTVQTAAGSFVLLQGILQGRTLNTSDTSRFRQNTSNSIVPGTINNAPSIGPNAISVPGALAAPFIRTVPARGGAPRIGAAR